MRKITCLLLLLCLLPSFALADKTITLTFTGDITLGGEDYLRTAEDSFFAVYEREGAGYFLKNFADFFAEDDLTVVNLEGVLTDNNALYPRDKGKGDDGYWFRGPAAYAKVLSAASVEVASLANNHAFDYGAQGFRDTIAAVEAEGLGWFGTYNKNRDPETEKFYFYTKDGVTICLMSLLWDDYNPQDPMATARISASRLRKSSSPVRRTRSLPSSTADRSTAATALSRRPSSPKWRFPLGRIWSSATTRTSSWAWMSSTTAARSTRWVISALAATARRIRRTRTAPPPCRTPRPR